MSTMLMIAALATGAPEGEQLELLTTFREEFIHITPGEGKFPKSFKMGDDDGPDAQQPAHEVTFDYDFHIAKYEMPQNLWESVMGSNPSRWKGKRNSVEKLSHADAVEFCRKATKLMREAKLIEENQVVRLPSEAEWEYTARAGTDTAYSFGDDVDDLDAHAWHTGNAAGNDPAVGELKPNPWGLYDVHGYLWEWCADSWRADYKDAPADGSPQTMGEKDKFVARSGSWKDKAERCTSRARIGLAKDTKDDDLGLRCVLADQTPK